MDQDVEAQAPPQALLDSLERSMADIAAGRVVDAATYLAYLERRIAEYNRSPRREWRSHPDF